VSLATLTSRLSTSNAARVTDAVNASADEVQAFLASGTDNAAVVNGALADTGVATANVLALLPFGDDRLLVITT
jgi:hypothetical protein